MIIARCEVGEENLGYIKVNKIILYIIDKNKETQMAQ